MGGTTAVKKLSKMGDTATGSDRSRLENMKRVVWNVSAVSGMLFIGSAYGLLLLMKRKSYCYWYEALPVSGYTYWWSITNVLLLMTPNLCYMILSLPGEKSVAKKINDAVSTALSTTTKAGGKNSKFSKAASSVAELSTKSSVGATSTIDKGGGDEDVNLEIDNPIKPASPI